MIVCLVGIPVLMWVLMYFYDVSPYELIMYHGIMLIMSYSWVGYVQSKYKAQVMITCTTISACLSMVIFEAPALVSAALAIIVQQLMVHYYERV